ncbi:YdeI/OmpD-associated family protein [Sphingomonas segetis]|uniref:YdeI/OmpD-associated family protein n=1 Tax=Sphingomonas segetis TaxID=1104779 RepID=UPI0012D30C03|nr:YdeI/OmpD-associated family protein [Sphingomonas segetis]
MSREPRIDGYIATAQPFARPILEKVRERVHAVVPDIQEAMKWSMPAYMVGGKIVLITAAFKAHMALNFWRGQELRGDDANADAMGQFGKIGSLDELPPDAELDRLIREAADMAKNAPAPRKTKHAPKPPPEMHPEFAAALANAPKAKAALDGFPPSAQRDYFEWIGEAKQDATRQKRIATAIEWLSEGKRRHWKYQNC